MAKLLTFADLDRTYPIRMQSIKVVGSLFKPIFASYNLMKVVSAKTRGSSRATKLAPCEQRSVSSLLPRGCTTQGLPEELRRP